MVKKFVRRVMVVVVPTLLLASADASARLRVESCSASLEAKVKDAYRLFRETSSTERDSLVRCMDRAYLVEHGRKSPSTIVGYLNQAKFTTIRCRNLDSANASAHRVYLKRGVMNVDRGFIRDNNRKRIASVMAHETMHNNGLNHDANDFGSTLYPNTVPEQIEACFLTGNPNPYNGPGNSRYVARDMVGFAIDGENNWNFAWSKDGTVTAGSSSRIHNFRIPYRYSLPPGYGPSDIVGMGIDGENNHAYVWFRDGRVSSGSSDDLDRFRNPYRYSLPVGYTPSDIVGMAVDGENNWNFVWFRDGRVSAGTSDDLDKRRTPYDYSLPPGYTPSDVVGMAIDGENNWTFAWYKDGRVSAGTTDDLDRHREPYKVETGR